MSEARPFNVLGVQQVAIGGLDKNKLRAFWVDIMGLRYGHSYKSEKENVDEDICETGVRRVHGRSRSHAADRSRQAAEGS